MRNWLVAATILVVCASPAFAQTPANTIKPTTIKGHAIDESFKQFTIEDGRRSQIEECRAVAASDHKQAKKLLKEMSKEWDGKVTVEQCQMFLRAIDGVPGTMTVGFPKIAGGCYSTPNTATFVDGKLSRIDICVAAPLDELLPNLIQLYGKPATESVEREQNGYGAQFELPTAGWAMPDGSAIVATDTVSFDDALGYMHYTYITVTSSGELKRDKKSEETIPNPFQ